MTSKSKCWEKIKAAYKESAIFPIFGFVLSVAGTFYSNFLENQIPPCLKNALLIIIILSCIYPLLKLIAIEVKRAFRCPKQFEELKEETTKLNNENDMLKKEIAILNIECERLKTTILLLINENYQENWFEVQYAYIDDKVVYIVIHDNGDQVLDPKCEVFVMDKEGGYQFGQYTFAQQKSDGVHLRNLGDVDRLLLSKLSEFPKLQLRPSVCAVQIVKKESFGNESN